MFINLKKIFILKSFRNRETETQCLEYVKREESITYIAFIISHLNKNLK